MSVEDIKIGEAPAYAWPGGYPIIYLMDDGEILCAECVNDPSNPVHKDGQADGWRVEDYDAHLEGPDEVCAHCGKAIPSAYGDPDRKDEYVVVENTPGYLPESEPVTFQTFQEALEYARTLRDEILDMDEDPVDMEVETVDPDNGYARFYLAREGYNLGRVVEVTRIED